MLAWAHTGSPDRQTLWNLGDPRRGGSFDVVSPSRLPRPSALQPTRRVGLLALLVQ
jgi:hypothetical protein